MARPKRLSDRDVLDAAARVIGRRGPAAFTLREVADAVGLSPATLIQRFGTKRGLLLALAAEGAKSVDDWFDRARLANPRPLDALVAALAEGAERLGRTGEAANHIAFLQLDLADLDLRGHTRDLFRSMRTNIERLLDEAVQQGALDVHDTESFARAIEATYHGTLLVWAVEPEGTPAVALRRTLGLLLGPRA